MRTEKIVLVILCIIGVAGLSYAQDENLNEEKRFSNETSISLVNTTGNTDTLSFAGKNEMAYKFSEKWTGSWLVGAIYNETDSEKETERYFTDLRADYAISDRLYAYGLGSWFQDKFSGFDNRIGIGPGLGYKYLIGPRHFLLFEGGLNYTYEDYTDPIIDDENFLEGRLFGKYEWVFTEKTGSRNQTSENCFSSMMFRMVRSVSIMPWVVRVPMFFMVSSGDRPMIPSVKLTLTP
jgi:putative salt-induced outer membrane protein YdiY